MCDPLTIASAAATAGSVAMNASAQSSVNKGRSAAMASERSRQAGFDAEAAAINDRSRQRYDNYGGQQDAKAKSLGDYFVNAQGTSAPAGSTVATETMPTSASNIVTQESAKQLGKAKAFTDQQGEALGNLRSFGDLLGGISREQGRDAGYVGQIGGFKKGSAAMLPYELDAASHAGDGQKMFGDLLGGLGRVGTSAALAGKWEAPGPNLPTMAQGGVGPDMPTVLGGALPQAPLRLSSMFGSTPTFAQLPNAYRGY